MRGVQGRQKRCKIREMLLGTSVVSDGTIATPVKGAAIEWNFCYGTA